MKISTVIITKNEEKNIKRLLESIKWTDEIILVDDYSLDNTVKIAKTYGAKIYKRKFDDFSSQKNYGINKANGEWILCLDADEIIPPALKKEIKKIIENSAPAVAYYISRRNIIFGKEIKHSNFSPDYHIYLFRKSAGKMAGKVHQDFIVHGRIGYLKNALIHYNHKNISEFVQKMNRYTGMSDQGLMLSASEKFSLFKMTSKPLIEFFKRFFWHKGFLDGVHGLILSMLMAFYWFIIYAKLWEKEKCSR